MKDFAALKEASVQDNLVCFRGLALLGGALAGCGAALALGLQWARVLPGPGTFGPTLLGLAGPDQALVALGLLVGAALGAGAALWGWLLLAQVQTQLGVPAAFALPRAAFPFAFFLPVLTQLFQGRPDLLPPAVLALVCALGFLWLAFLERGDKRKIFFAHPTEAEYSPSALFTHGGVITLGASAGWYLQSLSGHAGLTAWGLWLPLAAGLAVWFLTLGLGGALGFLYTKHTFNQSWHALALAALPLALLSLQSLSWVRLAGVEGGLFGIGLLRWALPLLTAVGGFTVFILALLDLTHRPVELQPTWEELFHALMLIAAVPLLLMAVTFWPAGGPWGTQHLTGPLDAFREGEPLAIAQAVLQGRLPFKEILFQHGFLSDAVTALAALGGIGQTALSVRLLQAWLMPLGLVAVYYLAVFCLPWTWALMFALALATGSLGWVTGTRFFFPLLGFLFTLFYLQRGRWPFLLFSALATVLALIASFSAGVLALGGHLVLLVGQLAYSPAEPKKRWLGLGIYLGATLVGLAPWWLYLAMSGSLGAYFDNFGWALTAAQDTFRVALPGWGAAPGLGPILTAVAPPLAAVLGLFYLGGALGKAREKGLPWNVLLLTTVVVLLWWRFLQRGDWEFLRETLPVAAMLLAFLLYRQSTHAPRLRAAVFGIVLIAGLWPRPDVLTLPALAGSFGTKNVVPVTGYVTAQHPGLSKCFLPKDQAKGFDDLAAYLDGQVGSAEAFYDFSNQPVLYFLVSRRPVVRALSAVELVTTDQQLEAIRDLQDAKVKAVVFPAAATAPRNGVRPEVGQYAVSEYLLNAFSPLAVKGGSVVLGPRSEYPAPDPAAAAALVGPLALGWQPAVWGESSHYDPNSGAAVGNWVAADGARSVETSGVTVTAVGEGIGVGATTRPVVLRLTAKGTPAQPVNVVVITLKVPAALDQAAATLTWGEPGSGRSVTFTLRGDEASRRYVFRVGAWPSWTLAGAVPVLRLTLPGGGWTWESARGLDLHDLGERVVIPAPAKAVPAKAAPSKAKRKK